MSFVTMTAMESKTMNLHGRSVEYVEAGSGPVLVLIHGMAGTCQNWRAVIEPLALHHTVIAPDLPGHGGSAPGGGGSRDTSAMTARSKYRW